jgi:wyosine [tRNA(Phe)-imidazoG37] synthetase (radical SAM superfamily)
VPVGGVLEELKDGLKKVPRPDFITLTGSGEPTLHSGLADVILGVRKITSLPVAILTNASLFYEDEVRKACSLADVVLPSLDAGDEETFKLVNRPAPGLTFQTFLDSLKTFWLGYSGQIWLEVFVIHPVTDCTAAVMKIARAARMFHPDWIHLITAVRPPAEDFVKEVPDNDLVRFAEFFSPRAQCMYSASSISTGVHPTAESVIEILKRRPCTLESMAGILNLPPVEIIKYVDEMKSRGVLTSSRRGESIFFSATSDETAKT